MHLSDSPPLSCSRELSTSHEATGHYCAARLIHIPAPNMLSCTGLCTASSFPKLLLFSVRPPLTHKHVACSFELHKLHLFSIVCASIHCFSLAPLYIFWMVVNAEAGFKIEFLYSLPSLCRFFLPVFPPSPSVFFSLAFPLSFLMTVTQAWNQFLILGQDDIGMRGVRFGG